MTSESRYLARDQRMNRNTVGIFFNMLEKVATENNPPDTPGNIFKMDKSSIQIYNKPHTVMTDKSAKNLRGLTSGGNRDNITMITRCNTAGQFKDFNKKQELGGGLHQSLDVYMNRKSSTLTRTFSSCSHSISSTQNFREGHSTFRWPQSLLQLLFIASHCC